MKRPIRTAARAIGAAALVAAASISCPNPIDEELLLVVEDSLAPELAITTPTPNSYYHGIMTVTGTLTDSSGEAGDGAGRLASLSFSVSDFSSLSRTVTFDADGNAAVTHGDPVFSWDPASGGFSFDFSTDGLFGYKVLTFVVTDANGNVAQRELPLIPYPYGPCIVLAEPVDLSTYDLIVAISGTVTDASGDSTTDEVKVLRWEATGGLYHELAIGPATEQPDGTYRSGNFTFDPLTGAFGDWFNSSTKTGPLSVKMRAMNASVWSEVTVNLQFNGSGPAITLAPAAAGHNPGEYSSVATTLITVDGTVDMTNYKAGSLRYLVLQQVGLPKTGTIIPDPATGAFSFSFNPDAVPVLSGNLSIEVSAQDNRVPPVESTATHACYDDPNPPAAPVVSGPASPTNNTTLTWTWTGDADTVEFRTSMSSATGPWTTTPDLSYTTTRGAGSYTLWVQGRDAVGNWSSSGSASVTVDVTPPAAPNVTGPASPTNNTAPTWIWTIPAGTVEFRYSLVSTTGPWTTTTVASCAPTLTEGLCTLWVQGRDAAGNWSSSDSASVTVDTVAPSAPAVTGPASPTKDKTPTWTWTASADTVSYRHSTTGATGPWTATGTASFTSATLADGSYTLWVQGRDAAGNWSGAGSAEVTIDNAPPDAPVVTGPTSPTNNTTPTWTWTGSTDTVSYQYSTTSTTGPWTATAAASYTPGTALGAGAHTLWVQARDAAGNWSSSDSASVTIDLTPPAAPAVTGPTTPTVDTTPTWSWSTTAGSVEWRYSLDGTTGPWTITGVTSYTPTLIEGSYTLWVQGRDTAGNWSSSGSASVEIDLTPPQDPTVTGTASPTTETKPTWTWDTPADAAGFQRSLDGGGWVDESGTSWTPAAPFSAGETHTLRVRARDALGNWSGAGSYTIVISP